MTSQIFGNLITTFVLGLISNVVYFLVLTILGCNFTFIQSQVHFCLCSYQMYKTLPSKEKKSQLANK